MQDLFAPLHKFVTVKVLGKLPCHLLLFVVLFFTNQNNILQLVNILMKFLKLNNFVIKTLLEFILDFLNLLLHLLLVVFDVDDLAEYLVLLLLVDFLQLLETIAQGCEACFHFEKLLSIRHSYLP